MAFSSRIQPKASRRVFTRDSLDQHTTSQKLALVAKTFTSFLFDLSRIAPHFAKPSPPPRADRSLVPVYNYSRRKPVDLFTSCLGCRKNADGPTNCSYYNRLIVGAPSTTPYTTARLF